VTDRWDYDNMFIDGAWTADDTVGVIEVIDPATEEVIGSVPDAGLKATHAAIAAARRAFDDGPWPRTSPRERAAVLRRFAAILDERHDMLKKLVMAESGSVGFLADIIQVRGTIDIAEWIAEAMELAVRWTEVSPPSGSRSVWWPPLPRSTSRSSSTS
jgi:aldehyde dehydrogenase (NAD+)